MSPIERLMGIAEVSSKDHLEGGMIGVGKSGGEGDRRRCREGFREEWAENVEAVANPICFSERR